MSKPEVYSDLTHAEALSPVGITNTRLLAIHEKMRPFLQLLDVLHWSYDGEKIQQGQLVVHQDNAARFQRIFTRLLNIHYPIQQVRPIIAFGWDDQTSMTANNTSAYRPEFLGDHSKEILSEHTRGTALDLNPLDNPMINADHTINPKQAIGRMPNADAIIMSNPALLYLMHEQDMEYGGHWPVGGRLDFFDATAPMDKHHFELRATHLGDIAVPAGLRFFEPR